MSDLFWAAASLPTLLFNWNPSVSIIFDTNDIIAVVEADEPVDIKGFLSIPLRDGECEANHDYIVSQLAKIWPVSGDVQCQVTERYSFIQVGTEITLAPQSYEGLPTPEIIVEARPADIGDPAFAHLSLRSSPSLVRLVEDLMEYASPVPVPKFGVRIANDSAEAVSLKLGLAFVGETPVPAGYFVRIQPDSDVGFSLPDVASVLVSQGQDHEFGTIAFLPPSD